jgi:hypothetical protein
MSHAPVEHHGDNAQGHMAVSPSSVAGKLNLSTDIMGYQYLFDIPFVYKVHNLINALRVIWHIVDTLLSCKPGGEMTFPAPHIIFNEAATLRQTTALLKVAKASLNVAHNNTTDVSTRLFHYVNNLERALFIAAWMYGDGCPGSTLR